MTCYDYVQVVAAEGEQKASLHLKVQFNLISITKSTLGGRPCLGGVNLSAAAALPPGSAFTHLIVNITIFIIAIFITTSLLNQIFVLPLWVGIILGDKFVNIEKSLNSKYELQHAAVMMTMKKTISPLLRREALLVCGR